MAKTNRDRVGEALELLIKGLMPFVEREMKVVFKGDWQKEVTRFVEENTVGNKKINLSDPQVLLSLMWEKWNEVFRNTLGPAERSLVGELRDTRNRWAHMENFSTDDTYRALDSTQRFLTAVSAPEAAEIEKQKMDLLRLRFEEQRRTESRRSAVAPVEGQPAGNLRPWREIVTPHPDVASGRYQQAEFAADLWQVYLREGSDEYKDPTEFFRRTFLTNGLKQLLTNALKRLGGDGGDPVVELQTNFGGGKTHSMLALYHIFSGAKAGELPGVEDLLAQEKIKIPIGVRRAVLVGTMISPGQPHKKPDGTVIRTLWGEIAWQLGGKEGYAMVADADKTATSPGNVMKDVLNRYSPCLILIDEWVAYARQLHDDPTLAAGTFDTQFTFAQTLTESVKAAKNAMLVVSIPASESPSANREGAITEIEIGGERGRTALDRLKNAIGRVEASWRPASQDEGFEIVRRRLFQPVTDPNLYVLRDQVARSFVELYGTNHQEFPLDCREAAYERAIKAAYPIHPELFNRLYSDWSSLAKFQRTRGVLRLMAAVIHCLWERQDSSLLIMPAHVPIDDPRVQFELTRYLEDQWVPVLEKDVDGQHSLPLALDRNNPNLGRYSACRRVARTIYMGSALTQRAANKGIDDRQIKLGCVQPGETVATFGDALRRLTDKATYLYVDSSRYWYSTQPTVARLADDRAGQLKDSDVADEIQKRLREQARSRGDFAKVHACVASNDVPDEQSVRLVILGPEYPHTAKDQKSAARTQAEAILASRGSNPRTYKNTLVFAAADATRLKELEQAVRQYLAWKSIWEEKETLNLDQFQTKQSLTKMKNADETVDSRIPEAFQWLLVPGQSDPKGAIEWGETKLQSGHEPIAFRASKKLKNDETLLTQMGGTRLRIELDRVPLWRGNHVSIRQLIDDFATYLYLPRVRDENVLTESIRDGLANMVWKTETFAYAESWDEGAQAYLGLAAGKNLRVMTDVRALLVRPDIALAFMEEARRKQEEEQQKRDPERGPGKEKEWDSGGENDVNGEGEKSPPPPQVVRRFYGSVNLNTTRLTRDAGQIADEVVQHLNKLNGAQVAVTIDIHVSVPNGVPEDVVRTVNENCRTLKFLNYGFEKE